MVTSASVIMDEPDTVPPGRNTLSLARMRTSADFMPTRSILNRPFGPKSPCGNSRAKCASISPAVSFGASMVAPKVAERGWLRGRYSGYNDNRETESLMSKPARSPDMKPQDAVLLREDKEGITTLTLNRPAARNALSEELMDALIAALQTIGGDQSVRAVIIAASGPVFCAGHDLKEMTARRKDADKGRAYFKMLFDKCAGMMQAI